MDSLSSGTRSRERTWFGCNLVKSSGIPPMLHFSKGNSKLDAQTLIFNLPAGKTCPGALFCKSFAVVNENGKRTIQDGEHTIFRCFAASSEVQYDAVFYNRAENLQLIAHSLMQGVAVDVINSSLQHHRTQKITKIRIHESGDFFSQEYLNAWIEVAKLNPDLKFYCYSKSLLFFMETELPENFYLTASYGGKFDYLIDEGFFTRYAKVFMTAEDAKSAGFKIDVRDQSCFEDGPFALLVHGTQPKGSEWGKASRINRKIQKEVVRN